MLLDKTKATEALQQPEGLEIISLLDPFFDPFPSLFRVLVLSRHGLVQTAVKIEFVNVAFVFFHKNNFLKGTSTAFGSSTSPCLYLLCGVQHIWPEWAWPVQLAHPYFMHGFCAH